MIEAKIDLDQNTLSINGHKVQMELTESGHMTLPWTTSSHSNDKKANQVLLTQKVSRKDFNQPEVMTAMIKEITNLNNNGTYTKVKYEPWLPTVDTMWVINRSTEDDGKNAGNIKARLVVRGDQDAGEDGIRCDSPTVDRTTVKFMLALAANQGFELRAVDISAAFLQGRELDREVYVRPPPEFKKPGIVWKLMKGLYGLKEAARLWYDKLTKALIIARGQKLIGDPACYLFFENGVWIGFVMIHVDDIIPGGTPEFTEMIMDTLRTQFKISKDQARKFTYIGMALRSNGNNIFMNQTQYTEELEDVPNGIEDNMSDDKLKAFL